MRPTPRRRDVHDRAGEQIAPRRLEPVIVAPGKRVAAREPRIAPSPMMPRVEGRTAWKVSDRVYIIEPIDPRTLSDRIVSRLGRARCAHSIACWLNANWLLGVQGLARRASTVIGSSTPPY